MDKAIYINREKTDYVIDDNGDVYRKHKMSISKTGIVMLRFDGDRYNKKIKSLRSHIKTPSRRVQEMPYNVWTEIPKDNFNAYWNIIESNYFKNTAYLLETDPGEQNFRKIKRPNEPN